MLFVELRLHDCTWLPLAVERQRPDVETQLRIDAVAYSSARPSRDQSIGNLGPFVASSSSSAACWSVEVLRVQIHLAAPGAEDDARTIWRPERMDLIAGVNGKPVPRAADDVIRPDVGIPHREPEHGHSTAVPRQRRSQ